MGKKSIWLLTVVGAAVFSAVGAQALQTGSGVVRGAQTLNLRAGAGLEYPPIGVLREGDRVEIKSINAPWATVRTSTGGTGYVRIEYLSNQAAPKAREEAATKPAAAVTQQAEPVVEEAPARAVPQAARGAQQAALLDELSTLHEQNAKLETELATLREQLAAAQGQKQPGSELDTLRADVGRVLALAEQIDRRVGDQKREGSRADPADRPLVDPNVWLLAGACVVFGVLLGGGYGRLQDRSRRTRIRL